MSLGENYFSTIVKRSIILIAIISLIILVAFKNPKPYIYGLLFGSIINLLNFRLMYLSTRKAMSLNISRAQRHAVTNYFIRYMIYAIVLIVSIKAEYLSMYTVILGFFTVKLVILSDAFYDTVKTKKR